MMTENVSCLRDVLDRIASYDAEKEQGEPLDEWTEAAAFHAVKEIAAEVVSSGPREQVNPASEETAERP